MENQNGNPAAQGESTCPLEERLDMDLRECQAALQEMKERHIYLQADFENYRKRVEKDRAQWIAYGQEAVLTDLLSVVDDFDRALEQLKKQELPQEVASHLMGVELIAKSLHRLLKKYDVEEIAFSEQFNPEIHEAIMQVKSEKPSGSVVEVLKKGYMHKGHILRPAQVSVAE